MKRTTGLSPQTFSILAGALVSGYLSAAAVDTPPTAPVNPSAAVSPDVVNNSNSRLPTDIYSEYFEARRRWATQNMAKDDILKYVNEQKQNIAFELKVSEGSINVDGPKVADDGRLCTNFSADRTNVTSGPKEVNARMDALAQRMNSKNEAPIADTTFTATHFKVLGDTNPPLVQLLYTCVSPNTL